MLKESPNPIHTTSPKPIRLFITIYIFLTISGCLIAAFVSQVIFWILLAPLFVINRRLKSIVLGSTLRFWCVIGGFVLNPFWRLVIVKPAPPNYKPTKTLVMLNHLSAADPWIAAASLFPWELKYVFKADLMKIPIAGWAIYMSGDIPIYFTKEKGGWGTRPGTISAMMEEVKRLQMQEIGQVIFPEGTRSKQGRLQPFKDGFFRFSVENGCEILPCVIHNAQSLWPVGSSLLDMGTVYFAYGEPLRPKEGETVEELKDRVKASMLSLFEYCPLYNAEVETPMTKAPSSRGHGILGGD